jgi:ABC-2 type transport system permease protein
LLSPVQWRELLLLARDRTFGVQTLAMPLLIVGMQILLNAGSDIFAGAIDAPGTLALIAFGLASYTLMFSEFRALNVEGQALWILYCVPRSIESVLREKVVLWSALAGFFPLVMFVIAMIAAGGPSPAFLGAAAVVVIGVPIFAVIATALGVFGCDPLANDVRARVRGSYLYLYMLLASLYSFAIFMQDFWQRAALITLTALLAVALWQNARAQLPYLLDPSASPPASVSVADGLIATLLFFVLQALIATAALLLVRSRVATPGIVLIAYCGAGAATYGVMRFVYWRVRTAGVPQIWGAGVPVALGWGAAGGVAAAAAAIAYVELAQRFGFLSADESFSGGLREILWLAAIAVLAAPVFEEFIFRGLIFGSLRRSLDFFPAAFASAAVFALVHPPAAVSPLVVLGLCAALAYERTGMLAAPIVAHGIYNASVLVWGLR